MSDHWAALRPLFDELVELDEAARAVRLDEIGARDADLQDRLQAMLAADATRAPPLRERVDAAIRSMEADPLGLVDATVGRYRVDALIGVGGMGVVYRATDLRLGRAAALKLLPPPFRLNPHAKQRFLNEARAASSLDHPNVCTVYEADEAEDGTVYLAMAYYEGETVRERLERGMLGIGEALDLASQAARGLAAAHMRGLVHRDIKPANLLVTPDGTLKILDFGIAKVADAGLTMPDQRPGTAGYMAPEQARGDPVDGRADLWSLGMVLYEMLTGTRPAGAADPGRRVPPASSSRAGVPPAVDALLSSMLAFHPDDRPLRADEVVAILDRGAPVRQPTRRVARRVALATVISLVALGSYVYVQEGLTRDSPIPAAPADADRFLAVLPFANASPETENEFFTDGMTEDILTNLAQVPELSVVSRTTSMGYKGTSKSLREIAGELGVRYVLEGSVRRVRNQVRITAQLVDGRSDQQLWAGSYDRELEDIFAVQTEIARAIAAALEVELSAGVATRIERIPTENLEAYDLFLLGRESLYRYDPEGIEGAMALFERALALDPGFALARAWTGRALAMYVHNQGLGPIWADSAVAVARRAIADQPDLPDAYTALGTALWAAGRYQAGISAFERALKLNPNDAIATHNLGGLSAWRGAYDEAIRFTRRSLELEPERSHQANANLTYHYALLGLFDRSEATLERARAVAPEAQGVLYSQARLALLRGRPNEAIRAAALLAAEGAENPGAALDAATVFLWAGETSRAREAAAIAYAHSTIALRDYLVGVIYGYALLRSGEPERGRRVLADSERYAREQIAAGHESPALRYSLASIHAVRGEREESLHWLNEAVRTGWNTAAVARSDPLLENLRGDPRFTAAVDRMERALAGMRARVEREGL